MAPRGIVYVAFGEKFLGEAADSAASAKRHMPDVPVALITGEEGAANPIYDWIISRPLVTKDQLLKLTPRAAEFTPTHVAFYNKIALLAASPYEKTLFLDTDTRVCGTMYEVFSALDNARLVGAHAPVRGPVGRSGTVGYFPEINTGLVGFHGAGRSEALLERWKALFIEHFTQAIPYGDQNTFNKLSRETRDVVALPVEFNARVSVVSNFVGPVRMLHGRDHGKLAKAEQVVNATEKPRLYVPGQGLIWREQKRGYLFRSEQPNAPVVLLSTVLNHARQQKAPPRKDHFTNCLEIQFFGLMRSGNHGVISWLCRNMPSRALFLNNVTHFRDPFSNQHNAVIPNTYSYLNPLTEETIAKFRSMKKDFLVYSYENLNLLQLKNRELVQDRERLIGTSRRLARIVLIRDLWNNLASRAKLLEKQNRSPEDVNTILEGTARLWKIYAHEVLGRTKLLGDAIVIQYNRWTVDEDYRAGLLKAIGLKVINPSIDHVPNVGGGSSFDGTSLSGAAKSMRTDNRFHHLYQDRFAAVLERLRSDKELIALNEEIFGVASLPSRAA